MMLNVNNEAARNILCLFSLYLIRVLADHCYVADSCRYAIFEGKLSFIIAGTCILTCAKTVALHPAAGFIANHCHFGLFFCKKKIENNQ